MRPETLAGDPATSDGGTRRLSVAHSEDADDAFYYAALRSGRIQVPGLSFSLHADSIHRLNQEARLGVYDVTAVSAAAYPLVADCYRILSAGTSVRRDVGPLLASRRLRPGDSLAGRRVGVAGPRTTGAFLLRLFHPDAVPVTCDDREMAARVIDGGLDAAVLIHEELLLCRKRGLHPLECLGTRWCGTFGGPLPVGLNLIHRRVPLDEARVVCDAIRRSLRYALAHREEVLACVSHLDRGAADELLSKFANEDSACMPGDVRHSLHRLVQQVASVYAEVPLGRLEIVD